MINLTAVDVQDLLRYPRTEISCAQIAGPGRRDPLVPYRAGRGPTGPEFLGTKPVLSRSKMRFRALGWDAAARSVRRLSPSRGAVSLIYPVLMRGGLVAVLVRSDLCRG